MCLGFGCGREGSGELLKRLSRVCCRENTVAAEWRIDERGETGSRETDHLEGCGRWGPGWQVAVGMKTRGHFRR